MRSNNPEVIRDVWADTLDAELEVITKIIEDYPYVSMDTEFPGVVARPVGRFRNVTDYNYQTMRCNVDLLKIIQLGLTFSNEQGQCPPECSTWQFNFHVDLNEDMYAQESIDLLSRSGIDFNHFESNGIDARVFGEKLTTSGIVLSDELVWVSFHSGYDFGYLVHLLTCEPMPERERDFFELLNIFFPIVYDVKHLTASNPQCEHLKGGLNKIAEILSVERVGPSHQAGSDSLLTAATFFALRQNFFSDGIDASTRNVLYNLGKGVPQSEGSHAEV